MRGRDTWPDHRRRRPRGRDGRFVKSFAHTATIVPRGSGCETVSAPPETSAHDHSATPREQHDHRWIWQRRARWARPELALRWIALDRGTVPARACPSRSVIRTFPLRSVS